MIGEKSYNVIWDAFWLLESGWYSLASTSLFSFNKALDVSSAVSFPRGPPKTWQLPRKVRTHKHNMILDQGQIYLLLTR